VLPALAQRREPFLITPASRTAALLLPNLSWRQPGHARPEPPGFLDNSFLNLIFSHRKIIPKYFLKLIFRK
jgi:hypothetical protein